MSSVYVSGVPSHYKLPKLLAVLKALMRKNDVPQKFWVRDMEDIRGTYLKSMRMEFDGVRDAFAAARILDGFMLYGAERPLTASVADDLGRRSPSPRRYRSRERYHDDMYRGRDDYGRGRYLRDRSRSPIGRETSKLDLEIELLRKQRMIIEEERRLIMEKKKLELVKDFGPRALGEYDLEEERDRRYRPVRGSDYRARRPSPPRRGRRPDSGPRTAPSREIQHSFDKNKLLQFRAPCKILTDEMEEIVEKHKIGEQKFLLLKLMKITLRKRIAVALEGKPIMSSKQIVALYRSKYPQSLDEAFVLQHVKELKSLHIPESGKEKEKEEPSNGEVKAEPTSPEVADIKASNDSPNITTEEPETEEPESEDPETKMEGSIGGGSSDALALHDKNDEDWVKGENDWTEEPTEKAE